MLEVDGYKSLPVRGAWIEMSDLIITFAISTMSLPVRGAWIEIPVFSRCFFQRQSLPVRGAWIEIQHFLRPSYP